MNKRIWLAEDDADDQEIFKEIIDALGSEYVLHIEANGEELIHQLDQTHDDDLPHLMIIDQNMPRMKGKETVELLRTKNRYKDIPAVIYSTYQDVLFADSCRKLHIDVFLKPDTFSQYFALVKAIIESRVKV